VCLCVGGGVPECAVNAGVSKCARTPTPPRAPRAHSLSSFSAPSRPLLSFTAGQTGLCSSHGGSKHCQVEGCRKNCLRSTNFCKVRESHNEAYLNHIILFLLYRLCKE
jgi:hypothetical protein